MSDLVETDAEALSSFRALAATLQPDDWSRSTECPGWDVHDQVAHVVALELEPAGKPLAAVLTAYGPQVRNPVGERMENGVDALRVLSPEELLARLGPACQQHVAPLRDPGRRHDADKHQDVDAARLREERPDYRSGRADRRPGARRAAAAGHGRHVVDRSP